VYKSIKGSASVSEFLCVLGTYLRIYSNEKATGIDFESSSQRSVVNFSVLFLIVPSVHCVAVLDVILMQLIWGFILSFGNDLILTHILSCSGGKMSLRE
jgi:hypothetical protein